MLTAATIARRLGRVTPVSRPRPECQASVRPRARGPTLPRPARYGARCAHPGRILRRRVGQRRGVGGPTGELGWRPTCCGPPGRNRWWAPGASWPSPGGSRGRDVLVTMPWPGRRSWVRTAGPWPGRWSAASPGRPTRRGVARREGTLLLRALESLHGTPDVLLVDATGRDHPRRAGLALHLGAVMGVPSIGVTHRPLVARGEPPPLGERGRWSPVFLDAEEVARWVCTRTGVRPVVAHAGWRTSPDVAAEVVLRFASAARTPATAPPGPVLRAGGPLGLIVDAVALDGGRSDERVPMSGWSSARTLTANRPVGAAGRSGAAARRRGGEDVAMGEPEGTPPADGGDPPPLATGDPVGAVVARLRWAGAQGIWPDGRRYLVDRRLRRDPAVHAGDRHR